jgi:hypothetical protein
MVESKIGSKEGSEQLGRYAEHLDVMAGFDGKALLYVTRTYDPKDEKAILAGLRNNVRFKQLRWHDFYRFLQGAEKNALVEELMTFMEEHGMARSYPFSITELAALSGIPRAFEIMEETPGGAVLGLRAGPLGGAGAGRGADRGGRRLGGALLGPSRSATRSAFNDLRVRLFLRTSP